jgi:tRNA U34 5-methylaminomethyl-2-thiouridine-forming methyltransferase MnmC
MWGPGLMQQVHDHTSPDGSFATYTAAAQVRRNLQAAGFTVTIRKGFAGKREMLLGRKQPQPDGQSAK